MNKKKANRRFQPMQKPLTIKEARDIKAPIAMYVEEIHGERIDTIWIRTNRHPDCVMFRDNGEVSILSAQEIAWKKYGKTWRCWLTRPTDEERAAAKWQEAQQ